VTISSWLNFGRPATPGRGSAAGRNFLTPPCYSQRAVFASPLSAFFIVHWFVMFLRLCLSRWRCVWQSMRPRHLSKLELPVLVATWLLLITMLTSLLRRATALHRRSIEHYVTSVNSLNSATNVPPSCRRR